MKMIEAIIRMAKINETKAALAEIGLPSFTATGEVQGRGRGRGQGPKYELLVGDPELLDTIKSMQTDPPRLKTKRMINMVVTDDKLDIAIETIIRVNKTGKSGDGKIFVLPIAESVQVRTGESGDKILD
jgi:nitrogen regulatory protein PII 2